MDRNRTKRIYDLHSWTGVLCGLFVYFVSFTGVVALFGHEIKTWEDPAFRQGVPAKQIEITPLVKGIIGEAPKSVTVEGISIRLPVPTAPIIRANIRGRDKEIKERFQLERAWHPATGEVVKDRGRGLSYWLIDIHRKLMLPNTIGRTLVGIAGVLLMLSIISGIVIHQKILRELLTWRLDRSVRLKWQDSHKAIGVWGLPFHFMIAFTGAFLGLIVVMLPITGILAFKGDTEAIVEAVQGPHVHASGVRVPMYSMDEARKVAEARAGRGASHLLVEHWGDKNARYKFLFKEYDKLARHSQVVIDGSNGQLLAHRLTERDAFSSRVSAAIVPLHYATYGGLWVKLLYTVLGIGLCVVIVTGMMLWLERRIHGNAGCETRATTYFTLSRLTIGTAAGLPLATMAIFYSDRFFLVTPDTRLFWTGFVYFVVWSASIFYAHFRPNGYAANRELLLATAVLALMIPVLSFASARREFALDALKSTNDYARGVDIVCFIVGLSVAATVVFLPGRRPNQNSAPNQG